MKKNPRNFERLPYAVLNARQKENYNFHKIAARLADYGYNCLRLTDDWHGADFIACHIDGDTFLKVQIKGRMAVKKEYWGKAIHIAFRHGDGDVYVYDHDRLVEHVEPRIADTVSWKQEGSYSWPTPPAWAIRFLREYKI